MSQLTKTELKVVHCISQGYVFKEIATMMFVSKHTVSTHVTNIRAKWNARNIADITRIYILSLDDPKLVMRAIVCLLIHVGVTVFEAHPELRKPNRASASKTVRSARAKTNHTYFA